MFVVCIICVCVSHLWIVLSCVTLVGSSWIVFCTVNFGGVISSIMPGAVFVSDNVTKEGCVFWFGRRARMGFVMDRVMLVLGLWIMC